MFTVENLGVGCHLLKFDDLIFIIVTTVAITGLNQLLEGRAIYEVLVRGFLLNVPSLKQNNHSSL